MEKNGKPIAITFREGRKQDFVEWKKEFDNLESLRNYLRIKMIKWISLRMFVRGLEKMITLKFSVMKTFPKTGYFDHANYSILIKLVYNK